MFDLFESFSLNKTSKWFVIFVVFLVIYLLYQNTANTSREHFAFVPWNMGTRFFPSYDLRGYPQTGHTLSHPLVYPWNYPYPGYPYLYWSPYFYEASGKYRFDPKYSKLLNESHKRILSS
jgi:hypothetical protein